MLRTHEPTSARPAPLASPQVAGFASATGDYKKAIEIYEQACCRAVAAVARFVAPRAEHTPFAR
eukprot:5954231-Pleurochrysis_carterae.AAC.1